ncbi:cupin domain-containing protein [Subtercola lobariae]|uniref:(S)-ureidoglycine aminohydrolase cupin domain-containing protein n=1 Tax=Subtercola lobariae TaxID=1588641 RepID=A0A917BCZ1_9MICO|nr:cupin domain-containing protein [Subtercola lobariae]GGF33856.1 hypothetical protein GCM10011399_28790 [Subtercola lobariae]
MSGSVVPHFNAHSAEFKKFSAGEMALLYASDDGTRLAGSFKESGLHQMTMPFDEFIYIVAGSSKITVEGETFEMGVGDACYLKKGMEVTFEHSSDFHDVTVLLSDTPIEPIV